MTTPKPTPTRRSGRPASRATVFSLVRTHPAGEPCDTNVCTWDPSTAYIRGRTTSATTPCRRFISPMSGTTTCRTRRLVSPRRPGISSRSTAAGRASAATRCTPRRWMARRWRTVFRTRTASTTPGSLPRRTVSPRLFRCTFITCLARHTRPEIRSSRWIRRTRPTARTTNTRTPFRSDFWSMRTTLRC